MAHSMRTLGNVDWGCHGSSATSMVYFNSATKARTYIAWNPLPGAENVQFYEGTKLLGSMLAAPGTITSSNTLQ